MKRSRSPSEDEKSSEHEGDSGEEEGDSSEEEVFYSCFYCKDQTAAEETHPLKEIFINGQLALDKRFCTACFFGTVSKTHFRETTFTNPLIFQCLLKTIVEKIELNTHLPNTLCALIQEFYQAQYFIVCFKEINIQTLTELRNALQRSKQACKLEIGYTSVTFISPEKVWQNLCEWINDDSYYDFYYKLPLLETEEKSN
jgi:hypothetical protein